MPSPMAHLRRGTMIVSIFYMFCNTSALCTWSEWWLIKVSTMASTTSCLVSPKRAQLHSPLHTCEHEDHSVNPISLPIEDLARWQLRKKQYCRGTCLTGSWLPFQGPTTIVLALVDCGCFLGGHSGTCLSHPSCAGWAEAGHSAAWPDVSFHATEHFLTKLCCSTAWWWQQQHWQEQQRLQHSSRGTSCSTAAGSSSQRQPAGTSRHQPTSSSSQQ